MSKKQIIKNLESVIKVVCADIKSKGAAGSDKIAKLSQLVNSYNRLNSDEGERDFIQDGIPGAYERLLKGE